MDRGAVESPTVIWFRRDLRIRANPIIQKTYKSPEPVIPVFVLDPALIVRAGPARVRFLYESLSTLDEELGGNLWVLKGNPVDLVPNLAESVGARRVLVSNDFSPYGSARDIAVAQRLAASAVGASAGGASFERMGSPYVIPPGEILSKSGSPYRVFTPYYRAWREEIDKRIDNGTLWGMGAARSGPPEAFGERLWGRDSEAPAQVGAISPNETMSDEALLLAIGDKGARNTNWFRGGEHAHGLRGGEHAAWEALDAFCEPDTRFQSKISRYGTMRDQLGGSPTSRLSPYLRFGCIDPSQVIFRILETSLDEDLIEPFLRQLCWRDFCADIVHHEPELVKKEHDDSLAGIELDRGDVADARLAAWKAGTTGYPIVDAGMRQLRAIGWMPNRVRMICASFLVKDLHIDWRVGAAHFSEFLVDADVASNSQNWQWVAGTGIDPSPFYRVFNPVSQALKFDPAGDYVRRWVPELAGIQGSAIHEPWLQSPGAVEPSYSAPIVDHAQERIVALERYQAAKARFREIDEMG